MKRILLFLFYMAVGWGMKAQAYVTTVYATESASLSITVNGITFTLRASDAAETYGSSSSSAVIPDCWVIASVSGGSLSDANITFPASHTDNNGVTKPIGILDVALTACSSVTFEGELSWVKDNTLPQTVIFKSSEAPSIRYGTMVAWGVTTAYANTFYNPNEVIENIWIPAGSHSAYLGFFTSPGTTFHEPSATIYDNIEYGATGNPVITNTQYHGADYLTVTYNRSFATLNQWYALFVPFAADATQWTGCQIAELTEVNRVDDADVMHWSTIAYGTLTPGKPYIIRRTAEGEPPTEYFFDDVEIFPATNLDNAEVDIYVDNNPANRCYTLHGTYSGIAAGEGPTNWYALHNGNFCHAGPNATLPANRFYLTVTENGETTLAPANTRMMVDDEVVGILEHFFEPQLLIDDNYYDVLGRRIDNPQAGQLYIHQGKKIIYSE